MRIKNKKEIAVSFLQLVPSGRVREAYKIFIYPNFYHYNPYFQCDRESVLAGMEKSAIELPNKIFEVVHALEDGDLVVMHGKVKMTPESPAIVLIHIFPFKRNYIIEEWEATQEIPPKIINENGIF